MGFGIKLNSGFYSRKPFYDSDTDIGEIKQVYDAFTMTANQQKDISVPISVANATDILIHQTSDDTGYGELASVSYPTGNIIRFDTGNLTQSSTLQVVLLL